MGIEAEASFGNFNAAVFAGNGLAEEPISAPASSTPTTIKTRAGGRLGAALSASLEVGGLITGARPTRPTSGRSPWSGPTPPGGRRTSGLRANTPGRRSKIRPPSPRERPKDGSAPSSFTGAPGSRLFPTGVSGPKIPSTGRDSPVRTHPARGLSRNGTQWALGLVYSPAPSIFIKVEVDRGREQGGDAWQSTFRAQAAFYF